MWEKLKLWAWSTDKGEARQIQRLATKIGNLEQNVREPLLNEVRKWVGDEENERVENSFGKFLDMYDADTHAFSKILHNTIVLQQRLCNKFGELEEHVSEVKNEHMNFHLEKLKKIASGTVAKLNEQRKMIRDLFKDREWLRDQTVADVQALVKNIWTDARAEKKMVLPTKRVINHIIKVADKIEKNSDPEVVERAVEKLNTEFEKAEKLVAEELDFLIDSENQLIKLVFKLKDELLETFNTLIRPLDGVMGTAYYKAIYDRTSELIQRIDEDFNREYWLEEAVREQWENQA